MPLNRMYGFATGEMDPNGGLTRSPRVGSGGIGPNGGGRYDVPGGGYLYGDPRSMMDRPRQPPTTPLGGVENGRGLSSTGPSRLTFGAGPTRNRGASANGRVWGDQNPLQSPLAGGASPLGDMNQFDPAGGLGNSAMTAGGMGFSMGGGMDSLQQGQPMFGGGLSYPIQSTGPANPLGRGSMGGLRTMYGNGWQF